MKISDIADIINVTEKDPSNSGIDVFVGLEHYDIAEPVIKRFGSTKMLSTAAKKFEAGDVLIARRNVYLQRASVARFTGLTSGDSIVLRVKKNLKIEGTDYETMCELLPFILNSINFWDYANTNADGTMSKRLSPAILQEYEFDLPSLDEQKVLAEKLWAAYEVKQSYLKMIDATQEMVKAQFVKMFGDKKINGKIADLVDTKIMSVKKTYESDDIIEYIDISSVNATDHSVTNTTSYVVNSAPSRAQQCVKYGDILVSTVRPINKNIAVINTENPNLVASTGFCVLRPNVNCKEYLLSIVTSDNYTNKMCDKASGGLYPAVNNGDVLSYDIYIPDDITLSKVSDIYNQADKSISELRKSIDAIDKVIKSLINENL